MKSPRILAIDTSSRRGSVALARGSHLVEEAVLRADMAHARDLLPAIDGLCRAHGWRPAEIDQCHLSIGPGSFTGLRVAVAFARHFALALGAKLSAVPTLDVIAENCRNVQDLPADIVVMLDAKRGQVFSTRFQRRDDRYHRTTEPEMGEPAALLKSAPSPVAVIGEGVDYHRAAIQSAGAEIVDRNLWWPRAANVHRVGWRLAEGGKFTSPSELVPFYLRRPEAEERWEKRKTDGTM